MIEVAKDYSRIRRLASEPVIVSNRVGYLIEKENGEDVGLWTIHRYRQTGCVQVHADMTSKCLGKKAIDSAIRLFEWIFNNLGGNSIFAEIPKDNKSACVIAALSGMGYIGMTDDNYRIFEVKK